MTINELIVQLVHTALEHGFNIDVAITDWDRHQQTLEGVVEDGCFDCVGTGLALDSPEWQDDLTLIRNWLEGAMTNDDFKDLQRIMHKRWEKYNA